jgi:Uma2 family endonuclease
MASPVATDWTDEALMALPTVGKVELINGKVIMAPTGSEHSDMASFLAGSLSIFVRGHRLGRVYDSSGGFRMASGNVLSPDVGFLSTARLKGRRRDYKRFFRGAPDLAAEILSPGDTEDEVAEKLEEYFANGTVLAWVIEPGKKTVTIYARADKPLGVLSEKDTLTAEEILPGFSLALAQLFEPPDFD